jgi:hypothetical protein
MLGRGAVKTFDTIPGAVPGYLARKASEATSGFKAIFDKYAQGVTDEVVQPMAVSIRKQMEASEEFHAAITNEVAMTSDSLGIKLKEDPNLDLNDPANLFAEGSPLKVKAYRNAMTRYAEGVYDPNAARLNSGDILDVNGELKEVKFVDYRQAGDIVTLVDGTTLPLSGAKPAFMNENVVLPDGVKKAIDTYLTEVDRVHVQAQDWGVKSGDTYDPYMDRYNPRQKSAELSQAEAQTGMTESSWMRPSQRNLMNTLKTEGGREMKYKAFADGTVGIDNLFKDKMIQDVIERLDADGQAMPLSHNNSQLVNKVFPDMVGIRHTEGFAQAMGMEGEEAWEQMFGDLAEAPLKVTKAEFVTKVTDMANALQAQIAAGTAQGVQPGRGWWKSWTDLRDPTKTYNFNMAAAPMLRIDSTNLASLAGAMSPTDFLAAKAQVDQGIAVFWGRRPLKKGQAPVDLLIAPMNKAKVLVEMNRLLKGLDNALANDPLNLLEAAHDEVAQVIGRNYADRVDKWMPSLDAEGKAVATSSATGVTASDTLKGWRDRFVDTKALVDSAAPLEPGNMEFLRLDDESLQALMLKPKQIEMMRDIRDKAARNIAAVKGTPVTAIVQDMSVQRVDRHRALALEAVDKVEKRYKKVYSESSPLVANEYLNKMKGSVTVVSGMADAITAIRKVQDKLPSQYGTGKITTDPKVTFDSTRLEGVTLKDAMAGTSGIFAGRVEPGIFLERLRQKWVSEGVPGFPALDPTKKGFKAAAAKQIEEILTLKAPADTWTQMRTLNEIGTAADLPELSEVLKKTATLGVWWKMGMLTAPATAVRDGFSSLVNAWAIGDMNPVAAIWKHGKKAMDFALGHQIDPGAGYKQIDDYLAQLGQPNTSANRARVFSNLYNAHYRHGSTNPNVLSADDARMGLADTEAMLQTGTPEKLAEQGSNPLSTLGRHLKASFGQTAADIKNKPLNPFNSQSALNPLNVAGAWTKDAAGRSVQRSTSNAGVDMMNGFRSRIDSSVRMMFILDHLEKTKDLTKTFEMADYALMNASPKNFTRFEHQYLKPLFPFYSFMRQSIPRFLKELMVNPGGNLGMTVRATRLSQGDDQGYVPFNLQDTSAIRLGEDQEGNIQYLTSLGLMHEDAVKYAGNALQRDWRGLLQSVVSSSSPAAKWVVEASTNTSLFSQGPMGGRRLDDLDPTLGRLATNLGLQELSPSGRATPVGGPMLESIAAASPIARLLSTGKIATDTRTTAATKVIRLLSGARIETVSQEQVTRDIRDRINALQIAAGARPLTMVPGTKELQEELVARGDLKTAALLEKYGAVLKAQKKEDAARKKAEKEEKGQAPQSSNPLVDMLQRRR